MRHHHHHHRCKKLCIKAVLTAKRTHLCNFFFKMNLKDLCLLKNNL